MYTINSPTIITYLKLHYEERNKTCYLGVINRILHHYRLREYASYQEATLNYYVEVKVHS